MRADIIGHPSLIAFWQTQCLYPRPSENRDNENSHSSLLPLFRSEHEHRYYKASTANPIFQLRGLRPGKIALLDVSAGRVRLLTWAHLHLELGWFHGVQLSLSRVVFVSPCGDTGGSGVVHWQRAEEGVFRTNPPFDSFHLTPPSVSKDSPDCRKNLHCRQEGIIYHGHGDGDPGGKEERRASVQCQNLSEKLSISWQAPPKHLLPCLCGGTWCSKPSSLPHMCQGAFPFLFMNIQRHHSGIF